MRGKKDERLERPADDVSADETPAETAKTPENVPEANPEVGPGGDNVETPKPLEQRNTKKDKKKKVFSFGNLVSGCECGLVNSQSLGRNEEFSPVLKFNKVPI